MLKWLRIRYLYGRIRMLILEHEYHDRAARIHIEGMDRTSDRSLELIKELEELEGE